MKRAQKVMSVDERLALILRNTSEIVTFAALSELLKKKKRPIVYCGYEPNGPLHLGHFVTITKLLDLQKAGCQVKILLADVHAMLNRKGSEREIAKEVEMWKKTITALGIQAEVALGSDFQFEKGYQLDVMRLAQHSTIQRGLRSMQDIARDVEHATISQVWYPLMQIVDIKHLSADIAVGGMEQRKVHMMGKDLHTVLEHDFIALHTPLISSLKGSGEKMSKSIPGSWIAVTDSIEVVRSTLHGAYCPEKVVENNPILQIARWVVFPWCKVLEVKRQKKFGGTVRFKKYEDLEQQYVSGALHPFDLKNAVAEELEKIIAPIRKQFVL